MAAGKIKAALIVLLFAVIAIIPNQLTGWGLGLQLGLPFACIILTIPLLFVRRYRQTEPELYRTYRITAVIAFLLVVLITWWQLPTRLYPSREVINQLPTDSQASFGLVTKNFKGPFGSKDALGLVFSPDGKKIAYSEWNGILSQTESSTKVYVIDETGKHQVGDPQDSITDLGFSHDSKHLGYIARQIIQKEAVGIPATYQSSIVIDGVVQGWEKGATLDSLGVEYEKHSILGDEKYFSERKFPICSNISLQTVIQGDGFFIPPAYVLVINGHKSRFINFPQGGIIPSQNCNGVAVVAQRGLNRIVIVGNKDGKFTEGKTMDYNDVMEEPQFSADGKYVQYRGTTDNGMNGWWMVERVQ